MRSRSAWNTLLCKVPVRAVTRQSTWRTSSPRVYIRVSANSMPRPRNGELPRPLKPARARRSEEHTSELQSLMRISYAVFCLKKKKIKKQNKQDNYHTPKQQRYQHIHKTHATAI